MARIALGESRVRARRRRRRILLGTIAVGLVVIVFAGAVLLSRAPFLQVTSVVVSGAGAVGSTTIQGLAEQEMAEDYLYFFSKHNIFLYPKQGIEQGLLQKFPTLQSAAVQAENFHTVSIAVTERKPVALWCGEDASAESGCYLLDADGFAYAPAPEYSGDAFEHYYGALATSTRHYLSPDEFRSLSALVAAIAGKETNEGVQSVFVDAQNDAHLVLSGGCEVRFGASDEGVFQRFTLALTADPFTAHPLSDFEYLDLRFGDKIYYKLKAK